MRRIFVALCVMTAVVALSGTARAEDGIATHNSIGLGFHNTDAPIGIRWWTPGQVIGIDAGVGFGSEKNVAADEDLSHWMLDFGVPIVMKSWPRFHALLRPGVQFGSQEVITQLAPTVETDNETFFGLTAEVEGELFLADNFSVSASTGIALTSTNPPGPGDNRTAWGTFGGNFTNVGFHMYLWGPYTSAR